MTVVYGKFLPDYLYDITPTKFEEIFKSVEINDNKLDVIRVESNDDLGDKWWETEYKSCPMGREVVVRLSHGLKCVRVGLNTDVKINSWCIRTPTEYLYFLYDTNLSRDHYKYVDSMLVELDTQEVLIPDESTFIYTPYKYSLDYKLPSEFLKDSISYVSDEEFDMPNILTILAEVADTIETWADDYTSIFKSICNSENMYLVYKRIKSIPTDPWAAWHACKDVVVSPITTLFKR